MVALTSTSFSSRSQAEVEHPPMGVRGPARPQQAVTCDVGVEVRGFEPLASSVRDLYRAFSQGTVGC